MSQITAHLAWLFGLMAGLFAAAVMTLCGLPFTTLVFRSLLSGVLIFFFVWVAGQVAGQSLLRGLAEAEVRRRMRRQKESAGENPVERAA